MRIVAIDASPRRGVVSISVEAAARAAEAAGAVVERVRLYDEEIRFCTSCGMCRITGRCKISDDLPALAERIESADGVIVGTPSYFRRPNGATKALIDRLSRYFRPEAVSASRNARRAVIITACAAPEPIATFFGYSTGPLRELRQALGSTGTRTVGSLAVTDLWLHPEMADLEQDRARSLGRMLAGKV